MFKTNNSKSTFKPFFLLLRIMIPLALVFMFYSYNKTSLTSPKRQLKNEINTFQEITEKIGSGDLESIAGLNSSSSNREISANAISTLTKIKKASLTIKETNGYYLSPEKLVLELQKNPYLKHMLSSEIKKKAPLGQASICPFPFTNKNTVTATFTDGTNTKTKIVIKNKKSKIIFGSC